MNPDQYIQKRARQLPLFECLVSRGWEVDRQPAVIVSRKHSNGNITSCLYVVDLLCLGVIFTTHVFNVSEEEYKELVLRIFEDSEQTPSDPDDIPGEPFERISYNLAHNIIYAGYEYAADYDIPPHKDFRVTRYMLEEDTEEIELVDIECGHNGKPLFVTENLTDYSAFKPEFIIKKLIQNAGEGNFEVISSFDFFDTDNDDEEYDFDDIPEGYINPEDYTLEDFEEDKKVLKTFLDETKEGKSKEDDSDVGMFQMIVMRMALYLASEEKVQEVYQNLFGDEEITVDQDWVPDEVLPYEEMDSQMEDKVDDLVDDIFTDDPLQMDARLKELHELVPNQPFVAFLELVALHSRNPKDKTIRKLLKKYTQLHPDDRVLRLFDAYYRVLDSKDISFLNREQLKLRTWFSGRRFLHATEAMVYCTFLAIVLHQKDSPLEDLLALSSFAMDVQLPQEINQSLMGLVMIGLTQIVVERALDGEANS